MPAGQGFAYVGGLVGYNKSGAIYACCTATPVTGLYSYVGGLAGWTSGTISNSSFGLLARVS